MSNDPDNTHSETFAKKNLTSLSGREWNVLLYCFCSRRSQEVYCLQFCEHWERGEIPAEHIPSQCWPEIDFSDFTLSSF